MTKVVIAFAVAFLAGSVHRGLAHANPHRARDDRNTSRVVDGQPGTVDSVDIDQSLWANHESGS